MSILYLSGILPNDDNNNIFIPLQQNGKFKRYTTNDFPKQQKFRAEELTLLLEDVEEYCDNFWKYLLVKRIHQIVSAVVILTLLSKTFDNNQIGDQLKILYIPIMTFILFHVFLQRIAEIYLKDYSRDIIFFLIPVNHRIFHKRQITINVGPYALYLHLNLNYTDEFTWHKQPNQIIDQMIDPKQKIPSFQQEILLNETRRMEKIRLKKKEKSRRSAIDEEEQIMAEENIISLKETLLNKFKTSQTGSETSSNMYFNANSQFAVNKIGTYSSENSSKKEIQYLMKDQKQQDLKNI